MELNLSLGLSAPSGAAAPVGPHVFLVAGQSNSTSRAVWDAGVDWPANIQQIGRASAPKTAHTDGALIPAMRPLDHHTQQITAGFGFALQFAIEWSAAHPGADLILVPCGMGGTGFAANDWNPGDALYADAVARVNTLMANTPAATFGGILWHQGENDAALGAEALYQAALDTFLTQIRADITTAGEASPIILGGMVPDFVTSGASPAAVNALIQDTPNRVPHTAFVDTSDLDDQGDDLHFDAASYRSMGSRYHAGLSTAQANVPTVPDQVTGLSLTPGDTQVSASWDAPASFGSGVVDYVIQSSTDGTNWAIFADGTGPATTAVVTGLNNDTPYFIRVAGVNATGQGAFSAPQSATPVAANGPETLFANSENGAWYDPSDLSGLWQDAGATTAVTGDGDPVGRIDDRSGNGHHLLASGAARPTYRASGGHHWLDFDGTAALMNLASRFGMGANPALTVAAALRMDDAAKAVVWRLGATSGSGILQGGGLAGTWGIAFGNGNERYNAVSEATDTLWSWVRPAGGDYASSQFFEGGSEQPQSSVASGTNTPTSTTPLFHLGGTGAGVVGDFRLYGLVVLDSSTLARRTTAETWLGTVTP